MSASNDNQDNYDNQQYDDGFQEQQENHQQQSKQMENSILKQTDDNGQSKDIPKLNKTKKTQQQTKQNKTEQHLHRYMYQIQQKFDNKITSKTSTQTIIKFNQKIKKMIKKYNDDLNEIVNRNLYQLTKNNTTNIGNRSGLTSSIYNNKHTTTNSGQNISEVQNLQQELSTNNKYQMTLQKQLQALTKKQQQIEQQIQQNHQQNLPFFINLAELKDQQILQSRKNINILKKQLGQLSNTISNNKKLLPQIRQIHPEYDSNSQHKQKICAIKNKLLEVNGINNKYQQHLQLLQKKQQELTKKLSQQKFKVQYKNAFDSSTLKQSSNKVHKQTEKISKKLKSSKNHKIKTQTLYDTKCNIIKKDTLLIKQKIQNIALEIKNKQNQNIQLSLRNQGSIGKIIGMLTDGNDNQKIVEKLRILGYPEITLKKQKQSNKKFSIRKSLHSKPTNLQMKQNTPSNDDNGENNQDKLRVWKNDNAENGIQTEDKENLNPAINNINHQKQQMLKDLKSNQNQLVKRQNNTNI